MAFTDIASCQSFSFSTASYKTAFAEEPSLCNAVLTCSALRVILTQSGDGDGDDVDDVNDGDGDDDIDDVNDGDGDDDTDDVNDGDDGRNLGISEQMLKILYQTPLSCSNKI